MRVTLGLRFVFGSSAAILVERKLVFFGMSHREISGLFGALRVSAASGTPWIVQTIVTDMPFANGRINIDSNNV